MNLKDFIRSIQDYPKRDFFKNINNSSKKSFKVEDLIEFPKH